MGLTPFHFAACHGHLDICKLIIVYLNNKNPRSNTGSTPLHFAARSGHFNICIENTMEINTVDNKDQTPKALAENNGHFEVAQLFVNT